jgi:hypothetical protein
MENLDILFVNELLTKGYKADSLDRFGFYCIAGVKPKDIIFVKSLIYVCCHKLLMVNYTKGTNKVEVLFN